MLGSVIDSNLFKLRLLTVQLWCVTTAFFITDINEHLLTFNPWSTACKRKQYWSYVISFYLPFPQPIFTIYVCCINLLNTLKILGYTWWTISQLNTTNNFYRYIFCTIKASSGLYHINTLCWINIDKFFLLCSIVKCLPRSLYTMFHLPRQSINNA